MQWKVSSSTDSNFSILISEEIELGDINFSLDVVAVGLDGYQYSNTYTLNVPVSLFQDGFPFDVNSEVKSAPSIIDLDNDGDNELIIADQSGKIRIIKDGEELNNDTFPFDVENQIWGAVSSADMDLDGLVDFVITSK